MTTFVVYRPNILRFVIYISLIGFVIIFIAALIFREKLHVENILISWLGSIGGFLLVRLILDYFSDKMIIVGRGTISGPPAIKRVTTEFEIEKIDIQRTNSPTVTDSLSFCNFVYNLEGNVIVIESLYFSPVRLRELFISINCKYHPIFWHRLEIALHTLLIFLFHNRKRQKQN